MGQKKSYAVEMDAQVKLKSEVCVGEMGQRGSFAALKDEGCKSHPRTGGKCHVHAKVKR
jgi:hypothetical protein